MRIENPVCNARGTGLVIRNFQNGCLGTIWGGQALEFTGLAGYLQLTPPLYGRQRKGSFASDQWAQ